MTSWNHFGTIYEKKASGEKRMGMGMGMGMKKKRKFGRNDVVFAMQVKYA